MCSIFLVSEKSWEIVPIQLFCIEAGAANKVERSQCHLTSRTRNQIIGLQIKWGL